MFHQALSVFVSGLFRFSHGLDLPVILFRFARFLYHGRWQRVSSITIGR